MTNTPFYKASTLGHQLMLRTKSLLVCKSVVMTVTVASFFRKMAIVGGLCFCALALMKGTGAAQSGGPIACPASGVLFQNTTSASTQFLLTLTGNSSGGTALSGFNLNWIDASGAFRSATINGQVSEGFAISLKSGASLKFSCSGSQAAQWLLGTDSNGAGSTFSCDSGTFLANGTLLINDQSTALNLLVAISGNQPNSKPITMSLSWFDSSGVFHSSSISNQFSKGVGISLGSGRQITYSCSTPVAGSWSAQPQ